MSNQICYILLLLFLQTGVQAQQSLRFKRLGVNNGLSQNTVIAIVQDLNGFIWLATQDGLNRYDGNNFKVYRHSDTDPGTLSNNYVMSLAVDQKGNVWAGTTNGLNKIDRRTGQLTRVDLSQHVKNASNYRIHSIAAAQNGCLYFGMNWELFCIDPSGKISRVHTLSDHLLCIELLHDGNELWIGRGKQAVCYDYQAKKVLGVPLTIKEGLKLLSAKNNILFFETGKHLYRHDPVSGKNQEVYDQFFNCPGSNRRVISILPDLADEWICTDNGLVWRRDKDTLLIWHLEDYELSLSSDFVYCVFKDRAGLYWISTSRGGLCIFDPRWQNFKTISKPMGLHVAVWGIVKKQIPSSGNAK